jgi:hypothetical protein
MKGLNTHRFLFIPVRVLHLPAAIVKVTTLTVPFVLSTINYGGGRSESFIKTVYATMLNLKNIGGAVTISYNPTATKFNGKHVVSNVCVK